jgi:hypothetical protein
LEIKVPEHQLAADYSWWFHLFALVGSFVLAGQFALQLFIRWKFLTRLKWFNLFLAALVVAVLVVDGLYLINLPERRALNASLRIGIVGVTILFSLFQIRLACVGEFATNRRRIVSSFVLLVIYGSLAGWSSHRFYTTIVPPEAYAPPVMALPGTHVKSNRYVGMTDKGREIPLYRWQAETNKDPEVIRSMMNLLIGSMPTVIQREGPDQRSNCHGWVFMAGRFLLTGNHVAQILEDNNYQAVSTPAPGDVVIYRNEMNEIVHTGLVAGILADQTIMIESKWSVGSRFLHAPDAQPYSARYTYYRTARPSNSLAIRFQVKEQVVEQFRGEPADRKKATQRPTNLSTTRVHKAAG